MHFTILYRLKYSFFSCALLWCVSTIAQDCNLSPIAQNVHTAVINADQSKSGVSAEFVLTTRNLQTDSILPPNLFPRFGEDMLESKYEVDIQTFLFSESDAVDAGLAALPQLEARLAQEGRHGDPLIIRFLLDVLDLTGAGIVPATRAAEIYAGIAPLNIDPQLIRIEIATHVHTFVGSNHSKSGILDGRIGYIGGANFDDTNDFDNPAFDSAYVFKGEVVKTLQDNFDEIWQKSIVWNCSIVTGKSTCTEAGNGVATHVPEVLQDDDSIPADTCLPVIALTRTARNVFNNDNDVPANQGFVSAIESAEQSVNIMTPNFNDGLVIDSILAAADRGVKVRLILSLGYEAFAESLPFQDGTNAEVVTNLLFKATPKQLTNLSILWYSKNGIDAVKGNAPEASHLKYMSIDGKFHIVGSSNMDTQSWHSSREINLGVDSVALTKKNDDFIFWPAFERSISVIRVNIQPIANAGRDKFAKKGNTVNLSATDSLDLHADIVSYLWEQTQGTSVTFSDNTSATPSFTLPSDASNQAMFFKLTVTDSLGQTDIDFMTVFPF